ncbi:hypothetical protein CfE428DRAFT_6703 [Chthoniobacter flavus Ellin428]|uniref:Uncharacterized protein n=1 Tax=Chthoniobacter flavus Ellin428 TaxID=497964 RepID=B4DCR2_9BACT|nr:hypothetical protein CfE428DRAFT_6703 [Chthoniobacter flavus Ellin428]TCO89268.1 hypothetical protein EV701_1141 [Chthoniobacter flavus]
MRLRTSVLFVLFLAAGAALFSGLHSTTYTTNCGGNSAALARVRNIATLARAAAMEAPDHSFQFTAVRAEQRELFSDLRQNHWLPNAHFLVCTVPLSADGAQSHRVIVVCDTAYNNVPRRWIGTAPSTHAAAFADGSSGLISAQEFAALDRSQFTPFDELFPATAR